jgi:DNA-binding PadR family transcriptional regulator
MEGGAGLSASAIGAKGKSAAPVLKQLCDEHYLTEEKKKYTVTPEGRAAWERDASPEGRDRFQQKEQQKKHAALVKFLGAVQQKSGKPLKGKDLPADASLIQDAVDRQLVQPGEKENSYRLRPAGEEMLLASLPVEEQAARLRKLHDDVQQNWGAALQRVRHDLDGFVGGARTVLDEVRSDLSAKLERARHDYDAALGELQGLARLHGAAKQLKDTIDDAGSEALRRVVEETSKLNAFEEKTRQGIIKLQTDFESLSATVTARLATLPQPPPAAAATSPNGVADEVVWEATQRAYEQLRSDPPVKVPELTDAVLRSVSGLERGRFHELLSGWQEQERVVLQVCNDRSVEPRAGEGIESPRGLLFYVQLQ